MCNSYSTLNNAKIILFLFTQQEVFVMSCHMNDFQQCSITKIAVLIAAIDYVIHSQLFIDWNFIFIFDELNDELLCISLELGEIRFLTLYVPHDYLYLEIIVLLSGELRINLSSDKERGAPFLSIFQNIVCQSYFADESWHSWESDLCLGYSLPFVFAKQLNLSIC